MVSGAQILNLCHVPFHPQSETHCEDALEQPPMINDIRNKVRKIVEILSLMRRPAQKLIQEVETRRDSTSDMLQRLFLPQPFKLAKKQLSEEQRLLAIKLFPL